MSLSPPRTRSDFERDGATLSDVSDSYQLYWCYQCNRLVRLPTATRPNLIACPRCSGQFLVEIEARRPRLFVDFTARDPFPEARLLEALSLLLEPPIRRLPRHGEPPRRRRRLHVDDSEGDNEPGIQSRPRTWIILRPIGPRSQFEMTRRRRRRHLPGFDSGDYFSGQGFNDLIEQITQNDRPGAPPATEEAISSIPSIRITDNHLNSDSSQCPVCKEEFAVDELVKQLPCHHIYHKECIVPWLALHNSCPICRKELQVEDDGEENEATDEVKCGRSCRWCRRLMTHLASLRPFRHRPDERSRRHEPPSSQGN